MIEVKDINQIRVEFIRYMKEKEYNFVKGDTLISPSFPTTFTVSGGPNFADKYIQSLKNEIEYIATVQRCFRHWDPINVGDGKHLSFFEMAVTSRSGKFSREEMYKHHLDFLVNYLGLDKNRFWITYFIGGDVKGTAFPPDEEAYLIWKKLGIEESHLLGLGGAEAFVANVVEPVGGPRTEIIYETDKKGECKPCIPQKCECGKFLEFFTSAKYNYLVKKECSNSQESPLYSFKHLQTTVNAAGFGVERLGSILFNCNNIYELDVIKPLIYILSEYIQKKGIRINRKAVIVSCEHLRGICFLINDGVTKLITNQNRSRKYVYRKYLKNYFKHLEMINLLDDEKIIEILINKIVKIYSQWYKELLNLNKDEILTELKLRRRKYVGV